MCKVGRYKTDTRLPGPREVEVEVHIAESIPPPRLARDPVFVNNKWSSNFNLSSNIRSDCSSSTSFRTFFFRKCTPTAKRFDLSSSGFVHSLKPQTSQHPSSQPAKMSDSKDAKMVYVSSPPSSATWSPSWASSSRSATPKTLSRNRLAFLSAK